MNSILELFGIPTEQKNVRLLKSALKRQICPFSQTRCFKIRKSQPEIAIGTCSVCYGQENKNVIICPKRLLHKNQVFCDCIHLLTNHEPGNEFHIIPEISIPGGSIDYFLVSVKNDKIQDFTAIEFQTMDTTGTVWQERQNLLSQLGLFSESVGMTAEKSFGMNWKMTAKTILVQLHHKAETLETLGKHLVLIIQDHLLNYMQKEFKFDHLATPGRLGDSVHFHSYRFSENRGIFGLNLIDRFSTGTDGIATCLGLQSDSKVEMSDMIAKLERKISEKTRMTI